MTTSLHTTSVQKIISTKLLYACRSNLVQENLGMYSAITYHPTPGTKLTQALRAKDFPSGSSVDFMSNFGLSLIHI